MKKKIVITLVAALLLVAMAFTLAGCAAGTYYLYDPIGDKLVEDSYIKLGVGGSIEMKMGDVEYKAGEYKYLSEKKDDGTTVLKVYKKGEDKDKAVAFGVIDENGDINYLVVKFKKK